MATTFSQSATGTTSSPSGIAFTFKYMWQRLGIRIKNDSSPSGSDLTEVKDWVNDGYLRFLSDFNWSFMTPNTTLSVTSDSSSTTLPSNFEEMDSDFTFSADVSYARIRPTTIENILNMRANADTNSIPKWYAIDAVTFDETAGQRWQVLFYPTAGSNYTLTYSYRVQPDKMTNDDDYPLGGSRHNMTILQAAYMIAEQRAGGVAGAQTQIYEKMMLPRSISRDLRNMPASLGRSIIPSVHYGVDNRIRRNTVQKS